MLISFFVIKFYPTINCINNWNPRIKTYFKNFCSSLSFKYSLHSLLLLIGAITQMKLKIMWILIKLVEKQSITAILNIITFLVRLNNLF